MITNNSRLFIRDKGNDFNFLVDTGADLSVLPPPPNRKITPSEIKLFAANGSVINTYGTKTLVLDLNLRRKFTWNFVIADVGRPIIGADFLQNFGLLVDVGQRRLVDPLTSLVANCSVICVPSSGLTSISSDGIDPWIFNLLKQYSNITKPNPNEMVASHDVEHHIITNGPPVFSKPRRLNSEKLSIAKREFEIMVQQGICRQSDSQYASPLHLGVKEKRRVEAVW